MPTSMPHSPIGTPISWDPLRHNTLNRATGGVWRVTGPGGTAILKHATPGAGGASRWGAGHEPRHWNYWRRECDLYVDGTISAYCGDTGLAAPRLLELATRPDGSLELWLEDVHGAPGAEWSTERLAAFARQLGRAQARAATWPEGPAHSRRWLRQYVDRDTFDEMIPWEHPLAATHWSPELREGLRMIWERRGDLLHLAESLPQTVCHLDVWPMNLIAPCSESVLLDWSFAGRGAIGEDISNLIADTFFDGLQPVDRLPVTETALTDAYLAGLADAGHHDEAATRKAIAATGAAKYAWLAPAMLTRLATGHTTASADYDTETDDARILERRRPIFAMLVHWARTALAA